MQREMYICRRVWANKEASLPPAPGWSSIRAGRWEKGWGGMREVVRRRVSWGRREVRLEMSAEARARSSWSEEGSVRRVWSSVRDCGVRLAP